MRSNVVTRVSQRFKARFCRDERGVAAVEFALLLPIIFMLFVGTLEFSQALTVDRRVTQVASSVADLVARTQATSEDEIDQIMLIADELMKPYDTGPLRVSVMNVVADINDATQTTVCWIYKHNGGATGAATEGAPYTLPAGIVEEGDSVVVAEVQYDYDPLVFSYFIENTLPMGETFFLKPRLSATIDYGSKKCL